MAASFPPNLDDGELWLPSDVIADVGPHYSFNHRRRSSNSSSSGAHHLELEALANQLAAFRLLETNPSPKPIWPTRQPVNPLPDLAEGLYPMGFGVGREVYPVGNGALFGNGGYLHGSRPVQQFNPVQAQMESRIRALQRFERVNGSGKMCRGTGVFLPRVGVNEVHKKNGSTKEVEQPQKSMKSKAKANGGVKLLPSIHQNPELLLPQEWTY